MRWGILVAALIVSGCAQYWVKSGVTSQQANADLAECRKGASNMAVMIQTEEPCMLGKGYVLSSSPGSAQTTMYWTRSGTGLKETGDILAKCRASVGEAGEAACMGQKGFTLSAIPPTAP